jgi:adenylate cyclase
MGEQSALKLATRFESRSFLLGLILTALLTLLWFLPPVQILELRMLDIFSQLKGTPAPHPQVVHVDIDDSSIEKIGRWPWDRIRHAQLVDVLTEAGAKAIVFDVTFPDPQSIDNDAAFAASCLISGRVYIGYNLPVIPKDCFEVRSLPWYESAGKELLKDLLLEPEELASRIGEEPGEVAEYFTRIKEAVIEDELRRRRVEDENFNVEDYINNRCQGGYEERAVRRIYSRLEAEHLLTGSALAPASGERPSLRKFILMPPLPSLVRAVKGSGFVSVDPDPDDGILRHAPLVREYRGSLYGYLSLVVLKDIEGFEVGIAGRKVTLSSNTRTAEIPLNGRNEALLDWVRAEDFTRIPFAAVVQAADMRETALRNLCQEALSTTGLNGKLLKACQALEYLMREAAISKEPLSFREELIRLRDIREQEQEKLLAQIERFVASAKQRELTGEKKRQVDEYDYLATTTRKLVKRSDKILNKLRNMVQDRICIIGSTHTGSTDLHPTPVATELPGCMAHSSFLSMFNAGFFPREPFRWSSLVMLVLGGLGISFVSSHLAALKSMLVTIAVIVGLSLLLFVLFASHGIYLGLASPLVAMTVTFAATTAYRRFSEEHARRKIRSIFQHQVGKAVADQIIQRGEEIELGGETCNATVYFSDIEGFTAIAEQVTEHELVDMLNEYFTLMCGPVVEKYSGYLDKFEGDAILAVFGVPLHTANHARDACYAALENRELLTGLRQELARSGKPEIKQRIGLSTGDMVVGYVGSPQRHDYTVIGDIVNLGQRLEAANKVYNTSIIIGEATFEAARDYIEARELDLARVPGRARPVRFFELAAKKGDLSQKEQEAFGIFAEALQQYRDREFGQAAVLFEKVTKLLPGDGPALLYMKRCRGHISSPPPGGWDGLHEVGLK